MSRMAPIKPLRWTVPGYFYTKSVGLLAGKRSGRMGASTRCSMTCREPQSMSLRSRTWT
jgi:hypothetical protein